jgi:hypothetical protein
MLNRFTDWISQRDFAAALFADMAVLSVVFAPLAGLVLALVAMRKGFWTGFRAMVYAVLILAGLIAIEFVGRSPKPALPTAGIFSLIELTGFWSVLVVLASLLGSGRSLALVVEITTLLGLAGVVVFQSLVPHPKRYWTLWFRKSMDPYFVHQKVYPALAHVVTAHAPWLIGTFAAFSVFGISLLLLVARWLETRLEQPGRFGAEFRNYRCGYVASFLFALVTIIAAVRGSDLFDNFSFVLAIMFIYQGLAVLQRLVGTHPKLAAGRFLVYVLLALSFLGSVLGPPVSALATLGAYLWVILLLVGFADNFIPPHLRGIA